MKDWEVIADNLSKAGWSLGWVSALYLQGRTIWIVDAHGYGKRFIVRADDLLTAFAEMESDSRVRRDFDRVMAAETCVRMKADCVLGTGKSDSGAVI